MKVISFDSARATWLFPLEEFAPASGANAPSILIAIVERYSFAQRPDITTREDMAKKGLPFGLGQFKVDNAPVIINDFGIYNDGLVAVSERTEWAEAFLEDVVSWAVEEYEFRKLETIRKLFSSTLIVEFERPLSRLISGYEYISELINARTSTMMPNPAPMQFSRLDFEIDKMTFNSGQVAVPKFILERRAGVPFEQERYFAAAAMRTTHHLEVLTEIEKLAATRA
jgi:hypothetical protein